MKKIFIAVALMGLCIGLADCAKKTIPNTANKPLTTDQISHGKTVMGANCNKCHKLHEPAEFTAQKWNKVLPRMVSRAGLSNEEALEVQGYVLANAKKS